MESTTASRLRSSGLRAIDPARPSVKAELRRTAPVARSITSSRWRLASIVHITRRPASTSALNTLKGSWKGSSRSPVSPDPRRRPRPRRPGRSTRGPGGPWPGPAPSSSRRPRNDARGPGSGTTRNPTSRRSQDRSGNEDLPARRRDPCSRWRRTRRVVRRVGGPGAGAQPGDRAAVRGATQGRVGERRDPGIPIPGRVDEEQRLSGHPEAEDVSRDALARELEPAHLIECKDGIGVVVATREERTVRPIEGNEPQPVLHEPLPLGGHAVSERVEQRHASAAAEQVASVGIDEERVLRPIEVPARLQSPAGQQPQPVRSAGRARVDGVVGRVQGQAGGLHRQPSSRSPVAPSSTSRRAW